MLTNRQVILLKVEVTKGVDAIPTAADALLVENMSVSDSGLRSVERPAVEANLGTRANIFGGRLKEITFDVEIKGSGTLGVAPEIGQALRGVAMEESIAAGVSVSYSPVSTGQEGVTIYRYLDGRLEKFIGCVGEPSFTLETGNKGMASFTFTGHFAGATDTGLIVPTYDTTLPSALIGGNFTIGAYGAIINSVNFSLSNTIATAPDFNSPDGYGEVRITKRDVQGSLDPEDVLIAVNDFDGQFVGDTVMAMSTGPIGPPTNRFQFDWPAIKYRSRGEADRDGIQTLDMGFGAAAVAGDDEVTILFN